MGHLGHRILYIGVLCGVVACNDTTAPDYIKSTGKEKTEVRQLLAGVQQIVLEDNIDLTLAPDSGTTIRVTAGANLLPDVTTDFSAGTLTIRNRNKFNWVRGYKTRPRVQVSAATVMGIEHNGIGAIACTDTLDLFFLDYKQYGTSACTVWVRSGRIAVDVNGSGSLTMAGTVSSAYMATSKLARVDAGALKTLLTSVNCRGVQPLVCRVADSLAARIENRGDVVVYGMPKFSLAKTGSGNVLFR